MDGLVAGKEVNIKLDTVKTVCRFVYHKYYTIKVANKSLKMWQNLNLLGRNRSRFNWFEEVKAFEFGQLELDRSAESFVFPSGVQIVHRNIISPYFFGCGAIPVVWREERRLRSHEHRVMREIFGTEREETTGIWRKLHIEDVFGLYRQLDIVKVVKG